MADVAFDPDKYLAEKGGSAQAQPQGFDPDKYLAEKSGGQPGFMDRPLPIVGATPKDVLHGAGKALDYAGGLVRTGDAAMLPYAAPFIPGLRHAGSIPQVVTKEDVGNAFKGEAPKSSEYMQRMGVGEGPSAFGVNARDVGGFAADMATDPTGPLLRAGKSIPYVGKTLGLMGEGAGQAAEGAGESIYKSGVKKIDERLAENGKGSLGDLLLKEGAPIGTTKTLKKAAEGIATDAKAARGEAYQKATDLGATLDLGFPLKNAESKIAEIADKPNMEKTADGLREFLEGYQKKGKVPLDKVSEWKTDLYNSLPDNAFGKNGKIKGPFKQFEKALSQDLKEGIEQAGNSAENGLGDSIKEANDKMGTVLSAKKPLDMQIRRGVTKNPVSMVDAILAKVSPEALAAKKTVEGANTTMGRTLMGRGLMDAGQSGLADSLVRRGLINMTKEDQDKLKARYSQ